MRARIGKEHTITLLQKHGSKSGYAFAIVSNANIAAIIVCWLDVPRPQDRSVCRFYLQIPQRSVKLIAHAIGNFLPMAQRTAMKMELQFSQTDATEDGQEKIDRKPPDQSSLP